MNLKIYVQKSDIDYENVRCIATEDKRIGTAIQKFQYMMEKEVSEELVSQKIQMHLQTLQKKMVLIHQY